LGIAYRNNKESKPEKTIENIEKSIEAFKKAQTACSGIAKAATANNLGLSLFDNKEFEEAQNEFERAITYEKESLEGKDDMEDIAFYYNNSGLCWYHLARTKSEDSAILENAIGQYNQAILADKRKAIHYHNRGNVYLNLHQYDLAIKDQKKALSIDNLNPRYYHAIGLTFQTKAEEC
jgi:tetratricopeptide (TPR) repeat protein